jgi:AcrR family transcriptional regulator
MAEKNAYHHGDLKNALIEAGIEILSKEGLGEFSLRKVARQAGVSHAAPYAHFADKQALVAAISTAGYEKLYRRFEAVLEKHPDDPLRQLVEASWAYVSFAFEEPDHFRITLSRVIEKEDEYPAFVDVSKKSFNLVVGIVSRCQAAGILKSGPSDLVAVSVWGLIHGFVSLILEGQVSRTILDRYSIKEMLIDSLDQISLVEILPEDFSG